MAVNVDLYRGDSLPLNIELVSTSSAGEAVFDLTGYTVTVSFRWPKCQTVNLSTELTVTSTAGTVTGTLPATATSTLPDAVREYLILETTAGVKQTYFIGRVNVISCESSTELCFNV